MSLHLLVLEIQVIFLYPRKNNFNIKKKLVFPDHYDFNKKEIEEMIDYSLKNNLEMLTTEKDFLRINKFGFKQINCAKLRLQIENKEDLINCILDLKMKFIKYFIEVFCYLFF